MPNGVDVGDAGPSLQQASAEAQQSLSDAGGASPVSQFAPAPPLQHSGPKQPARRPAIPAGPNPNATVAPDQGAGIDTGVHPDFNAPAPPKPEDTAPPEDNGDFWSATTFKHWLRDSTKGTGEEVANIAPRVGAQFGVLFGRAAAGIATIADTEINALNDVWGAATGGKTNHLSTSHSRLADASFKLVNDWLKPAVEHWTPQRAENTGQGPGTGGTAQAIGTGGEAAPYMAAGPAGIAAMLANSTTDSMYDQVDQGHDVKTAMAVGTLDGLANYVQMKFGVIASQPLLRRVLTAIPLGDLMKVIGDYGKKVVLHANGYDDAAAKIDPYADLGTASVQNAIFGVIGGHPKEKAKVNAGGDKSAPVTGGSASGPVPSDDTSGKTTPPAPPASAVPPAVAAAPTTAQPPVAPASAVGTAAPGPAPAVVDKPTPEPAKNLRAQFNDLRDKATPRTGVFVPTDNRATLAGSKDANAAAVTNQLNQAEKQGRTITLPQGTLVLKTVALKAKAEADLKAGKDPQDIIGLHTGAGAGKSPDQTAVVQGTTPSGAVATETAVHPADVPLAVEKVKDQGKIPVVTTPEAAIKARMAGISTERNTPTEMGIMTHPDGREIAVHVEPGAPEGQLRIRAIDAEGEPSDHHVDVPAERVKLSKPKEAAVEPTRGPSEEPKAAETLNPEPPKPTETVAPKDIAATEAPGASKDVGPEKTPKPAVSKAPVEETPAAAHEPASAQSHGSEDTSQPTVAPAPPAKVLKAVKPKSALESLSTSLETHEQQEAIPEGKKFAASLTERQDNASAFAAVLKAAADSARGKAGVSDIERALSAAKAAERLTEKGQVATAKGQGTGHVRITALVNEMHKAARGLLGKSHEGDAEKVAPKAAELKAKLEKVKAKSGDKELLDRQARGAAHMAEVNALNPDGEVNAQKTMVELNQKAHAEEQPGDVMMGNDGFVSLKDAVDAVRKHVEAKDMNPWPFQLSNNLNIAGRDAIRVLKEAGYDTSKWDGSKTEAKTAAQKKVDKAAVLKKKAKPKEDLIEVPVNPKYAGDIRQPKKAAAAAEPVVDKDLARKAQRLSDHYIWAENGDDAKAARLEVEKFLHENFPEHKDNALQLLDTRRVDENPDSVREKRMSETIEDDEVTLDPTDKYEGMQRGGKELLTVKEPGRPGIKADVDRFEPLEVKREMVPVTKALMGDLSTPDAIRGAWRAVRDLVGMKMPALEKVFPEGLDGFGKSTEDAVADRIRRAAWTKLMEKHTGESDFEGSDVPNEKLQAVKDKNTDNRLASEWNSLAKNADDNGVLRGLKTRMDSGDHVGAHDLLNRLIGSANTPLLRAMLQNLRTRVPDLPIYMVSKVKNLATGLENNRAAGLFSGQHEVIQATFDGSPARTLQNLVHEMRHAATAYELQRFPKGELAQASASARAILIKRLAARYGLDNVLAHMDFFEGKGPKPDDYKGQLYGIHSILEMHAELDNPRFVQEIIESEKHAQPGENIPKSTGGLLGKIYAALSKFFGVDNPRLLRHIAELHESTMDEQRKVGHRFDPETGSNLHTRTADDRAKELGATLEQRLGANPLEARKAAEPLMNLRDEEPPKLRGVDDELSQVAGDEPTKIARAFKYAVNTRAVDAVRTVVTRLKSVDQIFRDHRSDFGHPDDATNALSQLEDVQTTKNILMHRMHEVTRPVSEAWLKLPEDVNIKLGQLMGDTTSYKIDPRKELKDQIAEVNDDKKAAARHAEFVARYRALPADAREVYGAAIDANKRLAREARKAGIDAALHTFSDTDITPAQRSLLYGAKTHEVYDQLIGEGKLIDVGARNNSLREVLASFASQQETAEPYLHLGRDGDYVVHAQPEGTKEFGTRSDAEAFAERVGSLSPNSKATYAERGGKHVVDYKADYTSFHKDKNAAEAARDEMSKFGLDVGNVTQKTLGKENTPITGAARELVAEAERKINKMGDGKPDEGSQALVDSLRSALLQALAARSAYAGSKLARKASAGWKPEEMRKNFADYASSTIWHAAQLRTVFDQASALARVRGMARDSHATDQKTTYRRGQVVAALNDHMQDEVQNFGHKSPFNSAMAKLGFMSYLASPSHAFIWMTQNFTTGIPVAGARWGYGRATSSFMGAMKMVSGPAFRATMHNIMARGGNAAAVHDALVAAVKADPRFGKWAKGENSHFQQLIDRGVINHSYSNELGALARGDSAAVARAFEWARLLPNMADAFNRVSTALAGLEMTGGDLRKTADFVREIHADYSAANKPLVFKKLGRVPGGNSLTMFKTYVQAMAHLLYGNLKASVSGDKKFESAKTVAGLMVGMSMFAGVFGGTAIEPLRLAVYAYHKLFDDEGEAYDLKNAVHQWLVEAMGKTGGNLAAYGLPHALGFDLSSRMGLSDLFFHDLPDLMSASKDNWKNFTYQEGGAMVSLLADRVTTFVGHMQKGEPFQAISSLVPIKQWQDAVKAYQLATTGKRNSLGGQMTQPSLGDAAWQLAGLKPASVAEAQEKSGAVVNYKTEVKTVRDAIMKDYVSSTDKARALVRLNKFNANHPAEAIRGADLRGLMKAREMAQQGVSRDPEVTKRTNF